MRQRGPGFALVLLAAALAAGMPACKGREKKEEPKPAEPAHDHGAASAAARPVLFDNLGKWTHPVTTSVPDAQRWFDQGLRLAYGFNHDEAKRAFEEAARLDPKCAMAWWGVAFVLGPNINLPTDPVRELEAVEAVGKAKALAPGASAKDQAYVAALEKRYSTATEGDRTAKDTAFAKAMGEVAKAYPDDPDAATIHAEALMDLHPWDLWTQDGKPKPGTEEIVSILEGVLKAHPDHPGANHYYIHAVEASKSPERALASADRFAEGLVPGAGHLVHMPAHIYMRTGHYDGAVQANEKAAHVDEAYFAKMGANGVYPMIYYNHNLQFLAAAAAMEGRSKEGLEAARKLDAAIPLEMVQQMSMVEMMKPIPVWLLVRFRMWDDLLKEPKPAESLAYTTGMWHFGRGMAYVGKGDAAAADAERKELDAIRAKIAPDLMMNFNSAVSLLEIASDVLGGSVARQRGQHDEAIRIFRKGVTHEDALRYDEPPGWFNPVRENLGGALLAAGRAKDAEAVYREDLKRNPNSGWSLHGLALALDAQKKTKEAEQVRGQLATSWARADLKLDKS
jgi:tetratricopeptide (TPR) repeat protein